MEPKTKWLVLLFVCLHVAQLTSQNIVGCGGFVQASKELTQIGSKKIDYQSIKIELHTVDGILKDTTECAPNGYYFMPIYDKGSFKLKIVGPEGWSFEPTEVLITEGKCAEDTDINFYFTGFTLAGQVIGSSYGDLPCNSTSSDYLSGITITLTSPNTEPRRTVTSSNGQYSFTDVFPTSYTIAAFHPTWEFSVGETQFDMQWGNDIVSTPLIVAGYTVKGYVFASREPVSDVDFILYPKSLSNSTIRCDAVMITDLPARIDTKLPLCSVKSDSHGSYAFNRIPCGEYIVVPFYKRTHTTFEVVPKEIEILVGHGDVEISQPFQVVGFSAVGRVVGLEKQVAVPGVTILVDGQERALTDDEGKFRLDNVTKGKYTIEASKEHVFFEDLIDLDVSPNEPVLPDIVVSGYHLCGKLSMQPQSILGIKALFAHHRDVLLERVDVDVKSAKTEEKVITDSLGNFCFEVKAGQYKVTPHVSANEKKIAGLVFAPEMKLVTVPDKPVLEVNFQQAIYTVSGTLKCIEAPCDPSISVTLSGADRPRMTTSLNIGTVGSISISEGSPSSVEQTNSEKNATLPGASANEGRFVFRDVLPGNYTITVNKEEWCWDQDSITLEVTDRDITNIKFVQNGYILTSVVSHDITLLFHLENGADDNKEISVTSGSNRFCMKKPGIYNLVPVSCYKFQQDSYKYDTANPKVLDLTAKFYQVNGTVLVEKTDNETEFKDNISILARSYVVRRAGGGTIIRVDPDRLHHAETTLQVTPDHTSSEAGRLYRYQLWGALNEQIVFRPVSDNLLFYPTTQTVNILKNECPSPLPVFKARPGLFVSGRVVPAISGVKVTLYEKRTVAEDSTKSSGEEELMSVKTDETGNYKAGPLYDNTLIRVTAEKEGYHFIATPSDSSKQLTDFVGHKLGKITVVTRDHTSKGVGGVFLSLSGKLDDGTTYRSNNATWNNGSFSFGDLLPGSYFIKPVLKEYTFQPTNYPLTIAEGEEKSVDFIAHRVSFSCYGTVTSLNGEPEKMVTVEAVEVSETGVATGNSEECQTDQHGAFRLRGLSPRGRYLVRVKPNDERIERTNPAQVVIVLKDDDYHDLHFILFRKSNKFDISGEVETQEEFLDNLKVGLYAPSSTASGGEVLLRSIQLGPGRHFDFNGLSGKEKYMVRVSSNLNGRNYVVEAEEKEINLNTNVYLSLKFEAKKMGSTSQQGSTNIIYALLIGGGILGGVFYFGQIMEWVRGARGSKGL